MHSGHCKDQCDACFYERVSSCPSVGLYAFHRNPQSDFSDFSPTDMSIVSAWADSGDKEGEHFHDFRALLYTSRLRFLSALLQTQDCGEEGESGSWRG